MPSVQTDRVFLTNDPAGYSYAGTFNFIATETGANNAIVGSLWTGGAPNTSGQAQSLAVGLQVRVLLAHSLQAGANTFNFNAFGASPIVSSRNPANNIATAYVSGGTITMTWDGTHWQDNSQ